MIGCRDEIASLRHRSATARHRVLVARALAASRRCSRGCGGGRRDPAGRWQAPGGRGRELLGQHRGAARRRPGAGAQHHHQPRHRPAQLRADGADARTMAGARLAIVNGVGYDEWASKLLAASPLSGRVMLNVGGLLGLKDGDNPHRWYFPADVFAVVKRSSPTTTASIRARGLLRQRRRAFETRSLARYDELRREIRERYAGVPVGYSESIFEGLGENLGLKLLTPYSFAKAIAEGTEVTAQDKRTVDSQAEEHQIEVWVFNSQNVTPDVQRVNELARAAHIPIATVTETLSPATDSFEQWQVAQLERLDAPARGDGPLVTRLRRRGTAELARGAVRAARRARARVGGRAIWSDVDLLVDEGEFVAILGPNGAGQVDAAARAARPAAPRARHGDGARRRAGRAQRATSATCRSAASSTRHAGARRRHGAPRPRRPALGGAAAAGGPLQRARARGARAGARGDRARRRERVRGAADRGVLGRRAAAAADRAGARARAADADPRRAAGRPGPAQPGRGRGARAGDLPRGGGDGAARRARRQPAAAVPRPRAVPRGRARRDGAAGGGHHERDAQRALRGADRGAAHDRRTPGRRRSARGAAPARRAPRHGRGTGRQG